MRLLAFLFLLTCLFTSCIDNEFPSLEESEENIFGPDGPELFTVLEVVQSVEIGNLRRISVTYSSVFDQIPQIQRESIASIRLVTPTAGLNIPVTRTQFVDTGRETGSTVCYQLAFDSEDAAIGTSRATQFCILVE